MKPLLAVFFAGALFALGLGVGGMTQPAKILAFLDVAGAWDPSLVLVLGSAVVSYGILYRLSLRRGQPVWAHAFVLPDAAGVDRRLVAGSVVFGLGWGFSGFCPGPAIVALVTGKVEVLVFVSAMAVGIVLYDRLGGGGRQPVAEARETRELSAGSADG